MLWLHFKTLHSLSGTQISLLESHFISINLVLSVVLRNTVLILSPVTSQ